MTEQQWLECTDPTPMLEFLRGKASDRKLRLFAVGCCRGFWNWLGQEDRRAVEAVEGYADGNTDLAGVAAVYRMRHPPTPNCSYPAFFASYAVARLEVYSDNDDPLDCAVDVIFQAEEALVAPNPGAFAGASAQVSQAFLLREIIGSHFHPIAFERGWVPGTVKQLAEAIYETREFSRLTILADALEDAGCTSAEILNHCRQPGVHVRGCWVVDLLTGRG